MQKGQSVLWQCRSQQWPGPGQAVGSMNYEWEQSYRSQISTEDIQNIGQFGTLRKVCTPSKDFRNNIRVGDIKPIPPRRDHDESITHLMVRVVSILYLPCSKVVPGKTVVAEDSGKLPDEVQDLTVE